MSIHCDSKEVALAGPGKLQLRSSWTSNQAAGQFARIEVRLSPEGKFRFLVEGAQTTVVEATQRKIKAGTPVEISADYVNLLGGPNKRLVRFVFCGITNDGSGSKVEVETRIAKYLP